MFIKVEIQMYMADNFLAIVNRKYFERAIKNFELGNEILIEVRDLKGKEIMFNPKYAAYIKYLEVLEVAEV